MMTCSLVQIRLQVVSTTILKRKNNKVLAEGEGLSTKVVEFRFRVSCTLLRNLLETIQYQTPIYD